MNEITPSNPVVSVTPLRAYPGWIVRHYADGHYDAYQQDGVGMTIGCDTFAEVVAEVRSM